MWLFLHSALRSPQRVIATLKPRGRGNDALQLVSLTPVVNRPADGCIRCSAAISG